LWRRSIQLARFLLRERREGGLLSLLPCENSLSFMSFVLTFSC